MSNGQRHTHGSNDIFELRLDIESLSFVRVDITATKKGVGIVYCKKRPNAILTDTKRHLPPYISAYVGIIAFLLARLLRVQYKAIAASVLSLSGVAGARG